MKRLFILLLTSIMLILAVMPVRAFQYVDISQLPELKMELELTGRRTPTTKTYQVGPEQYRLEAHIHPIHYTDADGFLRDIDTTIIDGKVTAAPYDLQVYLEGMPGFHYQSKTSGEYDIRLESARLDGLKIDATVPKPIIEGNTVTWRNIYPGVDVRLEAYNTGVILKRIIKTPAAPLEYDVTITEISKGKARVLPVQPAIDATGQPLVMNEEAYSGGRTEKLELVVIPQAGKETKPITYPIIDATQIDEQVSASADDGGHWDAWNNTDVRERIGNWYGARDMFYRFLNITIDAGATIDAATVEIYVHSLEGAAQLTKVFAEDADNPTACTSLADQAARVRTTAGVDWDNPFTASAWNESPDIAAVIQELVDTYTISGDAIQILHDDDGSAGSENCVNARTYDWTGNTFGPQLHITWSAGGVSAPTLVTNAATSVEETTATLSGNITATGGENADERGFVYDTSSHGDPGDVAHNATAYTWSWVEQGNFTVGEFTHGITGLTKGDLYYYRAFAHNSGGWAYGNEADFLTKPDEPTNLAVAVNGTGQLDLTWAKGTGANNTVIRGQVGSYPADYTAGTLVYNNTASAYSHTGLTGGDTWYYRAWSWASQGGKDQYSDTYSQDNETALEFPTLTTNAASDVTTTTATLNGDITNTGGENNTDRGFVWDEASHGDPGNTAPAATAYGNYTVSSGSYGTGAFTYGATGLSNNTTYYYRAASNNTIGWAYGGEVSFTTLAPAPPAPPEEPAITGSGVTIPSVNMGLVIGQLMLLVIVLCVTFARRDVFFYMVACPASISTGLVLYEVLHTPAGMGLSLSMVGVGIYSLWLAIANVMRKRGAT